MLFFELNNLELDNGKLFHYLHTDGGKPVCIIGQNVRKRFFPENQPTRRIHQMWDDMDEDHRCFEKTDCEQGEPRKPWHKGL